MTKEYTSLGLMSGTSGDGVDSSIIQSDGKTNCKVVLNKYFDVLAQVFRVLAECEEGRPIEKLLDGPICHTGFNRLN